MLSRGRMALLGVEARRSPGRLKRVEDDLVDRPLRILVAIDGALDNVAQLADIARPAIGFELSHRPRAEVRPIGPLELGCHAPSEMLGEQRDVALAGAKRRQ